MPETNNDQFPNFDESENSGSLNSDNESEDSKSNSNYKTGIILSAPIIAVFASTFIVVYGFKWFGDNSKLVFWVFPLIAIASSIAGNRFHELCHAGKYKLNHQIWILMAASFLAPFIVFGILKLFGIS